MQVSAFRAIASLSILTMSTVAEAQKNIRFRVSELGSIDFFQQSFSGHWPKKGNVKIVIARVNETSTLRLAVELNKRLLGTTTLNVNDFQMFDVYSMIPKYRGNAVILEFKYGKFKNCILNDDGRNRLYVKFSGKAVAIERAPITC